ncbi:uncharacterized protein [Lolium perenne]|nr:uncharacterized protein LOC127346122 isoform X2 [Lolium perenne]
MMAQSYSIHPVSIQTLENFLVAHPLVHTKRPFGSAISIQVMKADGRFLLLAVMDEISEQHSENISWDGNFSIADILIVKYKYSIKMKIQKEPVKVQESAGQLQAKVNDLKRLAAIFLPLYEDAKGVLPVFLDKFKQDLEEVTTGLVEEKWFMEYLTYHVGIMPTTARRNFATSLISKNFNILRSIVLSKPSAYPNSWKTIVKSTKNGSITLLHDVYYHDNPCTAERPDKYESTVRGLIRFMRNVMEHGKRHEQRSCDYELEIYLAWMFPNFLPGLMRTLLQRGIMTKHLEDIWSAFKASKSDRWDP